LLMQRSGSETFSLRSRFKTNNTYYGLGGGVPSPFFFPRSGFP
jgi:hypothetical protein